MKLGEIVGLVVHEAVEHEDEDEIKDGEVDSLIERGL
jgi:hypothetical protein